MPASVKGFFIVAGGPYQFGIILQTYLTALRCVEHMTVQQYVMLPDEGRAVTHIDNVVKHIEFEPLRHGNYQPEKTLLLNTITPLYREVMCTGMTVP